MINSGFEHNNILLCRKQCYVVAEQVLEANGRESYLEK